MLRLRAWNPVATLLEPVVLAESASEPLAVWKDYLAFRVIDRSAPLLSKAFVDEGVTLRRIRPRAKGSASRILKRGAHITVVVEPRETKGA